MPRYRFSWDHIDEDVLRPLARAAGGDGSRPRQTLRDRYGARPEEDFVRDLWDELRESWLGGDERSRGEVIDALRAAGLGSATGGRGAEAEMAYLRSLRNAKTLRNVVLASFHRLGESPPAAHPDRRPTTATTLVEETVLPCEPSPEAAEVDAEEPTDGEDEVERIAEQVLALLQRVSGDPELGPDEDGDIPLRFGSSAVFVRVFGSPPVVRVYAPTLAQVPPDGRVLDILNNLNCETSFTKWLALNDTIFAAVDLFAHPLVEAHVVHACQVVGDTADHLDDQLQEVLGGKTFFGEYARPKLQRPTPGYL